MPYIQPTADTTAVTNTPQDSGLKEVHSHTGAPAAPNRHATRWKRNDLDCDRKMAGTVVTAISS